MNLINNGTALPQSNFVVVDTDKPISMDECVRRPPRQDITRKQMEVLDRREDERAGEMDMDAWREYTESVQRRWKREADFGRRALAAMAIVEENFKHAKTAEEKLQGKKVLYSEFFKIKEAQDVEAEAEAEEVTIDDLELFDRDNDDANLIGNRWLCKGAQAAITGPTGVGKSSLTLQIAIRWILGRPVFGALRPVKPMRVLLIQAENDLGDIAEAFQDMTLAMSQVKDEPFGATEMDIVRKNLIIRRVDSVTGSSFVSYLEACIKLHQPDIVFVDPFLAYVGDDALQQKVMSNFLRVQINPVLRKTGALLIWIHHVVKPGGNANGKEKSAEQNKYSGLGSSDFQNALREIIAMTDNGDGTFKLEFSKRGRRTGYKDENGNPTRFITIQHSRQGITWEKCAGAAAKGTVAERKKAQDMDDVRKFIKDAGKPVTISDVIMGTSVGEKKAGHILKVLAGDVNEQIWAFQGEKEKGARGPKPMMYSATKPKGVKTEPKARDYKENGESDDAAQRMRNEHVDVLEQIAAEEEQEYFAAMTEELGAQ
jgi:DNA replication protein DnaC